MISTTLFFIWFFAGLGGIGGWLLFFLLSAAAVIYIFFDSANRHLPALPWRLAVLLAAAMLIPTIVYRFLPPLSQVTLVQFLEWIFYLGLLGGIVPFFIALGYYLHFRGIKVCPNGHLYDAADGNCFCQRQNLYGGGYGGGVDDLGGTKVDGGEFRKRREVAKGFLLIPDNKDVRLFTGTTTIGRDAGNDIVFNERSVSHEHAKIIEEKNVFHLADLASKGGTWLNGRRVFEQVILETDDVIRFGEEVEVKFLAEKIR